MAEMKKFNTRIKLRIDTLEAWNSSTTPILPGELCFATVAASAGIEGLQEPVVMAKIGTEEGKTFSQLPWAFHAKSSDVLTACKSEEGLKAFVNSVIADAGIATSSAMEALAKRVTDAEGEIDTLQTEMDAVESKAAANETAIGVLNGLVGDTKVATQIADAIAALDLANTYEAKGEAAKVQTALDTYKTANDKAVADNKAAIEAEAAAARAAEKANADAITAIKDGTTIDSFGDVETELAKYQLAGDYATKTEAQAMADAKDAAIQAAQKAGDDAAAAAAKAQEEVDVVEKLVGDTAVGTQIATAIEELKLAETYAEKVHTHTKSEITDFAHNHEMGEVNGLVDALAGKQAVGDYATKAEAQGYADAKDEAIEAAQAAADKAQEEVDALETYVGTIPADYTESNVIAYINKKAQETLDAASGGSSESAASVLAALNTYKAENDPKVQANTDAIDALEELVGDTKVSTAIDTAVAAEKERAEGEEARIEGLVTAEKERVAGVEADFEERIATMEVFWDTTEDSDEVVNKLKEIQDYIASDESGALAMAGNIQANTKAIEDMDVAYKAADVTLQGNIDALAGTVATKAAQADLEAAVGRVKTVEDELNTAETGLKARMTAAEADIDALEAKVGDETVAAQIETAIEALKIGDYATAAALAEAIAQHNTDKAALEASIATKANDADLAAIAKSGNVNDLIQTEGDYILFDCGGAE